MNKILAFFTNRCPKCATKKVLDEQKLKHLAVEDWYCPICEVTNE